MGGAKRDNGNWREKHAEEESVGFSFFNAILYSFFDTFFFKANSNLQQLRGKKDTECPEHLTAAG